MPYVKTFDRDQLMMCSWDSLVDPESIARLIDAFVESLDLSIYEIKEASSEGRPSYDPKGLLKLYIYGSRKGIRSSRRLAESCRTNLEVKWMIGGVEPDFRTISDFRKDNIECIKSIFHEFNRRISGAVEWGFTSVDGSKFLANNSKDNNFTKNKLDDRVKWLNGHTDEYLRLLSESDEGEDLDGQGGSLSKEELENRLKEAEERLGRYKKYQQMMEESGASQLSLTDADAKLMKNKNGFAVAFNPQTAVDSNTHLIRDFHMTNQVTDHGMIGPTMEGIKKDSPDRIVEAVADKGYVDTDDMLSCLENGIIPNVITDDGKDGYVIETTYEENDTDASSTKTEELKKCLHAGVIPDAYGDVIENMEVKEVYRKAADDEITGQRPKPIYGTPEEMRAKAEEGYFVRDPERNLVYCPAGEIRRQKCIKKNGNIRYANKNTCRHCPNRDKCYKGKNEWKEIDFTKDQLIKPCRNWLKAEGRKPDPVRRKGRGSFRKVRIVRFFLKPDRTKMGKRMCLSEHPFGTIKRSMGAGYFLLRGMRKVTGEFALFCLGYNFERAKNLLGFDKMMELMVKA